MYIVLTSHTIHKNFCHQYTIKVSRKNLLTYEHKAKTNALLPRAKTKD